MSFGKSSGSSAPVTTQEQKEQIAATTKFLTNSVIPAYTQAQQGATDIWNRYAPSANEAAQNLGGVAQNIQQTLGNTGASSVQSGTAALESLLNPANDEQLVAQALAPAEAQYQQNLAMQQRQFGGAGVGDSFRAQLANQALAGQNKATQAGIAAQVYNDLRAQRAAAGTQLQQAGASQLGQALGAAGQQVTAAMTPQTLYNQYASVLFGTPAASYTPDFRGTQGTNTTGSNVGINFKGISF